jgi:hypothetical protein
MARAPGSPESGAFDLLDQLRSEQDREGAEKLGDR